MAIVISIWELVRKKTPWSHITGNYSKYSDAIKEFRKQQIDENTVVIELYGFYLPTRKTELIIANYKPELLY